MNLKVGLKAFGLSALIFVIQIALFTLIEYITRRIYIKNINTFYLFVELNILVFGILFSLFASKLKERKFYFFLILGSIPSLFSILMPLLHPEAITARTIDGFYMVAFIVLFYLAFKQTSLIKTILVALFGVFVFFTYKPVYVFINYNLIVEQKAENTRFNTRTFTAFSKNYHEIDPFRIKDKVVFLNIWNKSCGVCIHKFPKIKALEQYFKNDTNVVIISLYGSLQEEESKEWFFEKYVKKFDALAINYAFSDQKTFSQLKIRLFPTYFLIDKKGKVKQYEDIYFEQDISNNIYEKIKSLNK